MFTGYWIEDGRIYGPRGYSKSWVKNGHIYFGDEEYPRYWIREGETIHSVPEGDTGFYLENGYIYGPSEALPWLPK